MTSRLSRCVLAILDALDGLARRSPAEPPRASPAPAEPEPETITELVASSPCAPGPVAPPGNPRVLGYVLVAPRLGVLISVESHDGGSDEAPAASCVSSTWVRPARGGMPPDALTFRSEDDARRLMWGAPFAIPDETEVLPVVVEAAR